MYDICKRPYNKLTSQQTVPAIISALWQYVNTKILKQQSLSIKAEACRTLNVISLPT
jgi:hypothetical protein